MACFDDYITVNSDTPSRSGLYAYDLPGVDTDMLDGIAKEINVSPDYDTWGTLIYPRACKNLVRDVSAKLQDKFFVDLKLANRETSTFLTTANSNTGLAGIKFYFNLPRYSKSHILTIQVFSNAVYSGAEFKIYDTDEDGELLDTITTNLVVGRNTINIDTDYEVDNLFISYNPAIYTLRQTENKTFATGWFWSDVFCEIDCGNGERSTITQVNGGGINAKIIVTCSIEKFVCDNLNIFKHCLLWKIGQEITIERRFGERLTKFTTMTIERATELNDFYDFSFNRELDNAIKSQNVYEDPVCFQCKSTVYSDNLLP